MQLGFLAATGAFLTATAYSAAQILQVLGLLPDPLDRILIFTPSLLLAPCFVLAVAASCAQASREAAALRLGAFGLALLYAGFVSIAYVIQLGVVIPRELADEPGRALFACCTPGEPMTAIDLLGYTYLSLATLLLAPTYRGATRRLLAFNGVLAIPIFCQLFWPQLIWIASPWLVVFPAAMWMLAGTFTRTARPA